MLIISILNLIIAIGIVISIFQIKELEHRNLLIFLFVLNLILIILNIIL